MEEKDGAFVLGRRGEEDGVVAVGIDAAGDHGAGRLFDAQALCGDGDAAVRADAGLRACAPDVRPPRATRGGAQDGSVFLAGEIPCGLRGGADLAVLFLGVVVDAQRVDPEVGRGQRGDVFGGAECGEALLPEVVGALDFGSPIRGPPLSPPPPRPLACGGARSAGRLRKSAGRRRAGRRPRGCW